MEEINLQPLYKAMIKVHAEMDTVHKDCENPFFKSKYADLESIVNATRPVLSRNGLCVIQRLVCVDGKAYMMSELCHESGCSLSSSVPISPPKADPQSLGSYITYMRRYCYATLVGVITSDDDAEAAMKNERPKTLSPKQKEYLLSLMDRAHIREGDFLEMSKISNLEELTSDRVQGAIDYLNAQIAKKNSSHDEKN